VVIEIKVAASPEEAPVRRALAEALAQITDKGYAEALQERGAHPIVAYGIACCGKQVWAQRAGDAAVYGAVNWPADRAG
jgi:urease accessory protein UreF